MLHGKNYLPTGPKNNKRRRQGQWNSKHAPRGYTSSAPADFLFSPHHVRFSCMKKKKKKKKSPDLKILKSFVSLEEFIWFSLTIHKHQWTIYFPTLHCAQLSSKSNFPHFHFLWFFLGLALTADFQDRHVNLDSGLLASCLLMTARLWRDNPITMSESCPGSPYVDADVLSLLSNLMFRWRWKRKK